MSKCEIHPVTRHLNQLAAAFRASNHKIPEAEGYVIIYKGQAVGWVSDIHDSLTWMPGSLAIDRFGRLWKAVGGNNYDGVTQWVPIYQFYLSFEQVLEKAELTVSQMLGLMREEGFPLEFSRCAEGTYWLEADLNDWLNQRKQQAIQIIGSRDKLNEGQWPQLAETESSLADARAFIDIDKSTGNLLVIQTPSRSIGITLPDLMRLMASYRSPDKQPFLRRVLFGQRRHVH